VSAFLNKSSSDAPVSWYYHWKMFLVSHTMNFTTHCVSSSVWRRILLSAIFKTWRDYHHSGGLVSGRTSIFGITAWEVCKYAFMSSE
jgi:hypothetical protein